MVGISHGRTLATGCVDAAHLHRGFQPSARWTAGTLPANRQTSDWTGHLWADAL